MKIGVVIVTYNRLNKLKRCLEAYEKQTYTPIEILVIDNASTDGTENFLRNWQENSESNCRRTVIRMEDNFGGSGGFYAGIEAMLQTEVTWIWLADDDAYPERDCLKNIASYYENGTEEEKKNIVALCSRVNDSNGLSGLHRRLLTKGKTQIKEEEVNLKKYNEESFRLDLFSFVGTAIKTEIIQKVGLPRKEYFIYYDDSEYALRIGNEGTIVCVTAAKVFHDSNENTISKKSWKYYYMFRNKLYTYYLYFPKKYCFFEKIRTVVMICKNYNSIYTWKQWVLAMRDCQHNKMGKVDMYLPMQECKECKK